MAFATETKPRSPSTGSRMDIALNVGILLSGVAFFLVMRYPVFRPALSASQYSFNFGTVRPESELYKSFTVQNLHPWLVTVTGIAGSCGCTKPFLNRELPFTLRPLESVAATVQIETPPEKGDFGQTVTISTVDRKSDTNFQFIAIVH